MTLLFNGTSAANGFDSVRPLRPERAAGRRLHRLREPVPSPGCSANFTQDQRRGPTRRPMRRRGARRRTRRAPHGRDRRTLTRSRPTPCAGSTRRVSARSSGLLHYLIGGRPMNTSRREPRLLANPILIGALTVLVDDRRGDARLPGQQRAAVRARVHAARADPQRRRADSQRRGAHGRLAGRSCHQRRTRRATPPGSRSRC